MKRWKTTKLLAGLMIMTALFTGCSKSKETLSNHSDTPQAKGRYVEKQFKFPELGDNDFYQFTKGDKNGLPVVFIAERTKSNKLNIHEYAYDADGKCTKQDEAWMQSLDFDHDFYPTVSLQETKDGTQYLLVVEGKDDIKRGTLYCCKKNGKSTKINMEDWDKNDEDGKPKVNPDSLGVLDNGTIIVKTYDGLIAYDNTGKKQQTIGKEDANYDSFHTFGNKIISSMIDDGLETLKEFDIYDGTNLNQAPQKIKIDGGQQATVAYTMNSNGDLIYVNSTGICVMKQGTNLWQTVADGSLGTMYVPNTTPYDISVDKNNNYYTTYNDSNTEHYLLIKDYYDSSMPSVPDKELSVYSLHTSNTLRKAVNVFQQNHPDVKVNLQIAISDEEEENSDGKSPTKEDYIRTLNTQLVAGDGCDLINLDELPIDSYIEKGVLLDLTDLIQPLYQSNEYLNNIIDTNRTGDKIYSVPTRLELPFLMSPKKDAASNASLKGLVAYVKKHPKSTMFGNMTSDDMVDTFFPFLMKDFIDGTHQIDSEKLGQLLEQLKVIANQTGIIDQYTEKHRKCYFYSLLDDTDLCLESLDDTFIFTVCTAYMNTLHYDYSFFENGYLPKIQLGVNAASKQKKLAKEFVSTCLGEDVQQCIMSDGMPLRIEALEKTKCDMDFFYDEQLSNGSTVKIHYKTLSKDQRLHFIDLMKKIDNRAYTDDTILQSIKDIIGDYFSDKLSTEEATSKIKNKLSLYTQE